MALGLQAVWDSLVLAYNESIIDNKEFALLYNYKSIQIVCRQGTVCSGLEGLAYPCPFTDMAYRFGRSPPELCLIFNQVLDLVYEAHYHHLQSWEQHFLSSGNLYNYAQTVHAHGAPLQNCFGFVDGTVRPIARPKYHQRSVYNGHKRVHAMKFQSIVLPNGMICNLSGPYEGR